MLRMLGMVLLAFVPVDLSAASSTKTTIKSSASAVQYGQPVTLTATVSPASATGEVAFYRGAVLLETEPLGNGSASFTTSLLSSGGHSLKAYYSGSASFSASTSTPVSVTVNTVAADGFAAPVLTSYTAPDASFAISDFNGDGKADLAVLNLQMSTIEIFLGNGNGTFQGPTSFADASAFAIAVGDFNGDGKEDLVIPVSPEGLQVVLGNGDGTFQTPIYTSYGGQGEVFGIVAGDFNGDGKADVAMTDASIFGVDILLGNGDGTFQVPIQYPGSVEVPFQIVVTDFNGDGKADLAVASESGVNVLLGNGDGTFQAGLEDRVVGAESIVVGDFNGDGKTDMAIGTNQGAGEAVQLGNGNGTFGPIVAYVPLYGEGNGQGAGDSVTAIDFNGDGKLDLAGYSETPASLGIALGNGDGTFQAVQGSASAYGETGFLGLADFNGDGRVDILEEAPMVGFAVQFGSALGLSVTTVTSSVETSTYGEGVTLTANVAPLPSSGTVTFYVVPPGEAGESLGASAVTGGVATLSLSTLPGGNNAVYAVYNGDGAELPSASPELFLQVSPATSSTTLTTSPNPSQLNQIVTLVATVTPSAATGTVEFFHGATLVGTASLMNGQASVTTATLSEGAHSLTAQYESSSDYLSSTSPAVDQVVK